MDAVAITQHVDARTAAVVQDGVAPQACYSTTIYPTEVRVGGQWIRVAEQRMDAVLVVEGGSARCSLIRDLRQGERVVCAWRACA